MIRDRTGWLRAAAAGAALLGFVVGVPLALAVLVGWPLPTSMPNVEQVRAAGSDSLAWATVVKVLAVGAWAAWAHFTVCVLAEVRGELTGRHVSVPLGRVSQDLARRLVAAAFIATAVGGITPATAVTSAAASPPWNTVTAPVAAVAPAGAPAAAPTAGAPAGVRVADGGHVGSAGVADHNSSHNGGQQTYRRYTVAPPHRGWSDNLWDIAVAHLGDGLRWREIFALNEDRGQADGGWLVDPDMLHVGWQLRMPPDAVDLPVWTTTADAGRPAARPAEHTVRAGDTLQSIAQQLLGDPTRSDELFHANRGRQQPDGGHLTDPNVIRPGWVITTPLAGNRGDHAASQPAAPSPHGLGERAHDRSTGPAGTPGHTAPPVGQPAVPTRPEATPSAPITPAAAAPARPASRADGASRADDEEAPWVRTAEGIGAFLAAGLLLLLAARRAQQARACKPGQRVPLPSGDGLTTELELRAVEDPVGISQIDAALRGLTVLQRAAGQPLPQLQTARLTADHLTLALAQPQPAPPPWVANSAGTAWTLTRPNFDSTGDTDHLPAPYPSLVTLGHDADNAHVLIDLERAGALAVTGEQQDTVAVLTAMAVELATSAWADDLLLTVVGFGDELPDTLATGRVRHVPDVAELIRGLEGRADEVTRVLTDTGVDSLHAARSRGVAEDAWTPEIVLLADPIPDDLHVRLRAVLHRVPRVGVAVVTTHGDALGEWALLLDAAADGAARLQPAGLTLTPQQLTPEKYADILQVLTVTHQPPGPGPAWAANLPADEPSIAELPTPDSPPGDSPDDAEDNDDGAGRNTDTAEPGDSGDASPDPAAAETDPDHPRRRGGPSLTTPPEAATSGSPDSTSKCSTPAADDAAEWSNGRGVPHPPPRNGTSSAAGAAPNHGTAREQPQAEPAEPTAQAAPTIRLLGDVAILGARGPKPISIKNGRVQANITLRATAMFAYLAISPGAVDARHLAEALSPPGSRWTENTVYSISSKARAWLGEDSDGHPYFPIKRQAGDFRLHDDVTTDWHQWLTLIGDDATATPTPRLVQALSLVAGRPFSNIKEGYYTWAEGIRLEMLSSIVDVAHEVARRALLDGDAGLARHAVAVGRTVDPASERLWRDALRAEHVAGDHIELRRVTRQLHELADDLDSTLEPETEQLLADLRVGVH